MSVTFLFEKKPKNPDGYSEPFGGDLDAARTAYEGHTDRLLVEDGAGNKKTLKGLRFDANDIQAILDQEGCTELFLVFIESPLNKNNITIVATGIFPDATNPYGKIDKASVMYDYCEPCPNKCPSGM